MEFVCRYIILLCMLLIEAGVWNKCYMFLFSKICTKVQLINYYYLLVSNILLSWRKSSHNGRKYALVTLL